MRVRWPRKNGRRQEDDLLVANDTGFHGRGHSVQGAHGCGAARAAQRPAAGPRVSCGAFAGIVNQDVHAGNLLFAGAGPAMRWIGDGGPPDGVRLLAGLHTSDRPEADHVGRRRRATSGAGCRGRGSTVRLAIGEIGGLIRVVRHGKRRRQRENGSAVATRRPYRSKPGTRRVPPPRGARRYEIPPLSAPRQAGARILPGGAGTGGITTGSGLRLGWAALGEVRGLEFRDSHRHGIGARCGAPKGTRANKLAP